MKYGIIMHKVARNIGDDIQSYAAAKLLPRVDYVIDRENISEFCSDNNEPVGVIMNAWWMWKKWNWPPAECIYPLMTSMHICEIDSFQQPYPTKEKWLHGIGGDYFRAYGPIGCRDMMTLEILKGLNIDAYFSGCLTLTLPKQKETPDAGTYVCLVDLTENAEKAARKYLAETGLEIRVVSHGMICKPEATIEERFNKVEKLLTEYQNAKLVITSRLHVTLPCLALGTPVVPIVDLSIKHNYARWLPYSKWLNCVPESDFLERKFNYDFVSSPTNGDSHLTIRETLIKQVETFIGQTKDVECSVSEIKKTPCTEAETYQWRIDLMKWALDTYGWALAEKISDSYETSTSWKITKPLRAIMKLFSR